MFVLTFFQRCLSVQLVYFIYYRCLSLNQLWHNTNKRHGATLNSSWNPINIHTIPYSATSALPGVESGLRAETVFIVNAVKSYFILIISYFVYQQNITYKNRPITGLRTLYIASLNISWALRYMMVVGHCVSQRCWQFLSTCNHGSQRSLHQSVENLPTLLHFCYYYAVPMQVVDL